MKKHYQCLYPSTNNTMANPNNQAETTLKDDDSIAILMSTNYNIAPSSDIKRIHLEIPIPAQNHKTSQQSHDDSLHYPTCHCPHFPEAIIYDNNGNTINEFSKVKNYASYLCHFNLQHVKDNQNKKCRDMYLGFHQIHSSMPLSEICCHNVIEHLHKKVNT